MKYMTLTVHYIGKCLILLLLLTSCTTTQRQSEDFVQQLYSQETDRFSDLNTKTSPTSLPSTMTFAKTSRLYFKGFGRLATDRQLRFLRSEHLKDIDPGPFPENESPRTKAEIQFLLKAQRHVTRNTLQRIQHEFIFIDVPMGPTVVSLFNEGPPVVLSTVERTASFLLRECVVAVLIFKAKYDRTRPSFLSTKIHPPIFVPLHPAYPSGHATQAFCLSNLLSALNPADSKSYVQSAKEIAMNRELAGVHYPSDTHAGKHLANKIWQTLMGQKQFAIELEKARLQTKTEGMLPHLKIYMDLDMDPDIDKN